MEIRQIKKELAVILAAALLTSVTATPALAATKPADVPEFPSTSFSDIETSSNKGQERYEMTLFDGQTFYHPDEVTEDEQGRDWLGNQEVIWLDDDAQFEELLLQYGLSDQIGTVYALLGVDLLSNDSNDPDWQKIEAAIQELCSDIGEPPLAEPPLIELTSEVSNYRGKTISGLVALETGKFYTVNTKITTSANSASITVDYNEAQPNLLIVTAEAYDKHTGIERQMAIIHKLSLTNLQKRLIKTGLMSLVDTEGKEIHQGFAFDRAMGTNNAIERSFDITFKLDYVKTTAVITDKATDKVYLPGDTVPIGNGHKFRLDNIVVGNHDSDISFEYDTKKPTIFKVHTMYRDEKTDPPTVTFRLKLTNQQKKDVKAGKLDLITPTMLGAPINTLHCRMSKAIGASVARVECAKTIIKLSRPQTITATGN